MNTSKRILAVGVTLAAVTTTGIAFAAWTATGNGSGAAKATTMTVTVSAATAPGADLFPGGSAGDMVVKVTNPNSGPIVVTGITTDASGTQGGCTTGGPALTYTPGTALLT